MLEFVKYRNRSGRSSIVAYKAGPDEITVEFSGGQHRRYTYKASKVGVENFNRMIELAEYGEGLNSFIQTTNAVKFGYSDRR